MAQWIFRQTSDPTPQGRVYTWIWQLERSRGQIVKQSASGFSNLILCMDDAAKHGYYGGHYSVDIRPTATSMRKAS